MKLKNIFLSAASFMMLLASVSSNAKTEVATPDGFNTVLLYMGTGIFEGGLSEPRPGLICQGLFCNGEYFQQEIMHRTAAETAEIEVQAKAYFYAQFGLDVDSLVANNRASFVSFTLNPDFQYRVQIATGMKAPGEGWIIRDGGFRLMILDPNGVDLGGEMAGKRADQFNAMFFGNYNILATGENGEAEEEILVFYRSKDPAIIGADGSMTFRCNMYNEKWGEGLGLGTLTVEPTADGKMRGNARNVLSFPPTSDVLEFPSSPAFDESPKK